MLESQIGYEKEIRGENDLGCCRWVFWDVVRWGPGVFLVGVCGCSPFLFYSFIATNLSLPNLFQVDNMLGQCWLTATGY